jgi:hypothetical protein
MRVKKVQHEIFVGGVTITTFALALRGCRELRCLVVGVVAVVVTTSSAEPCRFLALAIAFTHLVLLNAAATLLGALIIVAAIFALGLIEHKVLESLVQRVTGRRLPDTRNVTGLGAVVAAV